MKVFVLGADYETTILRVLPNRTIGSACQSDVSDMSTMGIGVRQLADELR